MEPPPRPLLEARLRSLGGGAEGGGGEGGGGEGGDRLRVMSYNCLADTHTSARGGVCECEERLFTPAAVNRYRRSWDEPGSVHSYFPPPPDGVER